MIVVTAPTSRIGSQVLQTLVPTGKRVRVIARDPSKLPAQIRQAVDVVVGSHSDANVVQRAFQNADTVFWLVPADPRAPTADAAYLDFARAGCDAMKTEGIARVVGISALGRGWSKDAGNVTSTLKLDDMVAATGVSYRALTCPGFMDNVLRQVELIKQSGMFSSTAPADMKAPTCATRDIASAAVGLLLDETWTGVGHSAILGPEDLSFGEMAEIMSDALGRPIRYEQLSIEDFRDTLLKRGASRGMTQAVVNMMVAKNEGIDRMERRDALSTTPTTFRWFCERVLRPAIAS
jgi:uncharacterized protein YbjT (DUF2867 family)